VRRSPKSGAGVQVVIADGEIVDGSNPAAIGGDDLAQALREAREDDDVRAVVLRVDSPGGSATASDVIRAEVLALKAAGKPVIVSMGSVAASGGYWISADADAIVAQPHTLTGSIGVFGMLPNVEALAERYGLRAERVATSPLAGVGSMWKRLDEPQLALVQGFVDEIYERFLDLVAQGRKLDRERVAEIAQGRVWTGTRAKELGLVDELGGLERAIELARERAGLSDKAPVRYPQRQVEWFEELLEEILEQEGLAATQGAELKALGRLSRFAQVLEHVDGAPRVLARLPFEFSAR
jgi:protease-4